MITLYHQPNCPHLEMIQKRLAESGFEFEILNLEKQVPSESDLGNLLMAKDWSMRELFDCESAAYRSLEIDEIIYDLKVKEAFDLLRSNGRLVASPFVVTDGGSFAPVTEEVELDAILGSRSAAA